MPGRRMHGVWLFLLAYIFGCGGSAPAVIPDNENGSYHETTGACVGAVDAPPQGIVETEDEQLLSEALGEEDAGKLCMGEVFSVSAPVKVYRVWNSEADYTLYGRWWSFDEPKGPREAYRKANDICEEWSPLDVMSSCTLKVGAKIVMGPGQSVKCENGGYPKSPVNQVYVPNDARNNLLYVEDCSEARPWP